jgi:hypothetical protein
MKTFTALLVGAAIMVTAGSSWAIPYTWKDTIEFDHDRYVGMNTSMSYTHDLTDNKHNAFIPSQDVISDYKIKIRLYDDKGRFDFGEVAFVNQPGLNADGLYDFSYKNNSFGWSFAGLMELNSNGKLDVAVQSLNGDFYLDYSKLTANGRDSDNGRDNAPVPEPGTMVLLGFGMLGLAGYGKLHLNRKS